VQDDEERKREERGLEKGVRARVGRVKTAAPRAVCFHFLFAVAHASAQPVAARVSGGGPQARHPGPLFQKHRLRGALPRIACMGDGLFMTNQFV
jgi:hypothetical protein